MQSKNLIQHLTIISLFFLGAQFSIAQNIGDKYPKDKELIKEGNELHDQKKYDEADKKQ